MLLAQPDHVRTVRLLAEQVESSYANVHGAVEALVRLGYVEKLGGHRGIAVRDPAALLRAWIASGEPTALAIERFNARDTSAAALSEGARQLAGRGIRSVFSLGSALREDERWASALPQGLYCDASSDILQEAFALRPHTPFNFFILRPEPAANTEAGGIYFATREVESGSGVCLPQLIVDLNRMGGRSVEQAERLMEAWSRSLPLRSP